MMKAEGYNPNDQTYLPNYNYSQSRENTAQVMNSTERELDDLKRYKEMIKDLSNSDMVRFFAVGIINLSKKHGLRYSKRLDKFKNYGKSRGNKRPALPKGYDLISDGLRERHADLLEVYQGSYVMLASAVSCRASILTGWESRVSLNRNHISRIYELHKNIFKEEKEPFQYVDRDVYRSNRFFERSEIPEYNKYVDALIDKFGSKHMVTKQTIISRSALDKHHSKNIYAGHYEDVCNAYQEHIVEAE